MPMNGKVKIKILVDLMMTVALFLLMGYQFWGERAHEWAGAAMLALFLFHNFLNRSWYRAVGQGAYSPFRVFQTAVNALVFLAMGLQMYSGIVMSRYVFDFLPVEGGMAAARRLHILGAYWGFLLMSVHLGMHWNYVLGMVSNLCGKGNGRDGRRFPALVPAVAGALVACRGVLVFVERDFLTYMFLRSEFVFLDYGEPKILFYADYLSLMGVCVFLSHYLSKWLKKTGKQRKGGVG